MKHYTIPFFILHEGCPNQCIFCDQRKITGKVRITPKDISSRIEMYLRTIDPVKNRVEVGFFGGSFTGLELEYQRSLLAPIRPFIREGKIRGIRLSTRPDYINEKILLFLKNENVTCVELGVQSMVDKVLYAVRRGHTSEDIMKASKAILDHDFALAHQVMPGLPHSRTDDEYYTALKVKKAGAKEVRIYPALVIKGTKMAEMWEEKLYIPLSEEQAVQICAELVMFFEVNSVKVIRCGLHPSKGLLDGTSYLDGPFHPAFGAKVRSRIFSLYLKYIKAHYKYADLIEYNPKDKGAFAGFKGSNKQMIRDVSEASVENENVTRGDLLLTLSGEKILLDKKKAAPEILPGILKPDFSGQF